MNEEIFDVAQKIYNKFKLNYYSFLFSSMDDEDAVLTPLETFTVEVISLLERPTINQLARFLKISQPNAAYKVASLVEKGFVTKTQSEQDKREYYLDVTEKFQEVNEEKNLYVNEVMRNISEELTNKEQKVLLESLTKLEEACMPSVKTFIKRKKHY